MTHYILIIYLGQNSEIQKEGKGREKHGKQPTIVIDVNEKKKKKKIR